jgi:hypothetical protein
MLIRSFIVGLLEVMRRVQWNFCKSVEVPFFCSSLTSFSVRLENEHLGNIDQYRVTREVPLPYAFDRSNHDEDGDSSDPPQSPASEKS